MLRNALSIRRKLTIIMLAIAVVVSVLLTAVFLTSEYLTFRRTTADQLAAVGKLVAANSTAALAFNNRDDAESILGALKADRAIVAAVLYDRQGQPFAVYPTNLAANQYPSHPGEDIFRFGGGHVSGFQPVIETRRVGTLFLDLDMSGTVRAWIWAASRRALGVTAVVLVIAYLVSRMLQREISDPILELAGIARRVSERRDYSERAAVRGRDEVGHLATSFNEMLDEIQDFNRTLEERVATRTVQLVAVNKELEAFSYSVSHDLRAPLRHIDGFAQLLQRRIGPTLGEVDLRYLNNITASAKGLGRLIDELLSFSRMSRTELNQIDVDFSALVREVSSDFAPELQGRRLEWEITDLPRLRCDAAMFRQVWRNLLGNAVKYTRQRELARVQIAHRIDPADGHVFSVADNGTGFEMQYAAKLFGVFQRLHDAAEFEGTGIGLANVRRIVQRHGGRTWAEGALNVGATFYFSLPVQPILPLPVPSSHE